jgi:hypothetical protein
MAAMSDARGDDAAEVVCDTCGESEYLQACCPRAGCVKRLCARCGDWQAVCTVKYSAPQHFTTSRTSQSAAPARCARRVTR